MGGRRHDDRNRDGDQNEGQEMERLHLRLELTEAVAECRNQLKPEQRLDSRQHHPGLLDGGEGQLFGSDGVGG
jgi:hypothetical protein